MNTLDKMMNIMYGVGVVTLIGTQAYYSIKDKKIEEERKEENYNNEMIRLLEEYE